MGQIIDPSGKGYYYGSGPTMQFSGPVRVDQLPEGNGVLISVGSTSTAESGYAPHTYYEAAGTSPLDLDSIEGTLSDTKITGIIFATVTDLQAGDYTVPGFALDLAGNNAVLISNTGSSLGYVANGGEGTVLLGGTAGGGLTNIRFGALTAAHMAALLAASNTWALSQIFSAAASFQSPTVPFVVVGTDQVNNLTAQYVGAAGQDAAFFRNAGNLNAGQVPLAHGGTAADNGSQVANRVFASPASGGAGAMSIRALVAADIPPLTNANIDAAAAVAWSKISKSGAVASDVGALASAAVVLHRLSANVALSASVTVALSDLDWTAAAGETWEVDYMLPISVTGGTAGLNYKFTLPASTTGWVMAHGTSSGAAVVTYNGGLTTNVSAQGATAFLTASFLGWMRVTAVFVFTISGTVSLGLVTGASAAGNVLINGRLVGRRIIPAP
jgi:hypothetical protein